jgi:phosphoserine phosphatase
MLQDYVGVILVISRREGFSAHQGQKKPLLRFDVDQVLTKSFKTIECYGSRSIGNFTRGGAGTMRRLLRWLDRDMYIQYDNACGTTATAHNYIHLHTTT